MTDMTTLINGVRVFHLDEDKIPAAATKTPPPHLSHGRQVTINKRGRWVCVFVREKVYGDRNFLTLATANQDATHGSQLAEPIYLLGKKTAVAPTLFEPKSVMLGQCALTIDEKDRLTVFVEEESGILAMHADASADKLHDALSKREAWTAPAAVAPAGAKIADVLTDEAGKWWLYYVLNGELFELPAGGAPVRVAQAVHHASVHLDTHGVRHLAIERDRRLFYAKRRRDGQWSEPVFAVHFCASHPCIATTTDGRVVIVYQGEGKIDLRRFPSLYGQLRDAGGCSISYAILDNGRWTHHDLVKSRNITYRRRLTGSLLSNLPSSDIVKLEEFWRPGLAIDKHGVLWLFYSNTTRRHIFWSRFTGQSFGTPHEARGAFDNLSRFVFVQKESRGQGRIGYMSHASEHVYFDAIDVPDYRSTDARRVVFLDNLEAAQMVNVEHRMGQWTRHPEPIWGWGITGETIDDNFTWCHVTKAEGGFEMKYSTFGKLASNCLPGRAFSKDGLKWEKREPVDWHAITLDGVKDFSSMWRPQYLEDKDEKDPRHRYKGLCGYYAYLPVEVRKYAVVTSPDAIHWTTWPGLDAVATGDIAVQQHLFRDDEDADPSRRYKFLGLMSCHSGRAICVFTSPDLIHWSKANYMRENPDEALSPVSVHPTGPIAIDPDGSGNPFEEEVHDAYAWRENGILMFHYDAFRFHANQHIEKALAMSRDGRHYWRVKRGELNMPGGAVGSFDSGRARTSLPIRVDDELWLYYCGMPAAWYTDADDSPSVYVTAKPIPNSPTEAAMRMVQRPWRVGLAKLRVDGWAFLQLHRDAREGHVTTIPFDYRGGQLVVNGSDLGAGEVVVEVRTADDGKTVAGFEGAKCKFSAPDSVRSLVTWEDNPTLPPGRYRVRFHFQGLRAKLYAFGFEQAK